LPAEQRDQAYSSLAKDYLRAGLLDRAENMFVRLADGSRFQVEALEQLCRIYEQEKEWQKAVDAGQRLEVLSGRSLALQIAHYYCELAEKAAESKDFSTARGFVKKAQSGRPRTFRGALTRADIARAMDDSKTALRLYNRIIDENTYLITEALPRLVQIYREEGSTAKLEKNLRTLIKNNPEIKKDIAYTAIVNDIGDIDVIDECVEEYILNEPTLTEFINVQHIAGDDEGSRKDALKKVRAGLSKLAASTPRYQCKECGFSTQRLLWQCPSCKDWETQRPFASVQFDSLLQRSGINH
jgi:lipopolysaccharide biosynthesis regulator YciM